VSKQNRVKELLIEHDGESLIMPSSTGRRRGRVGWMLFESAKREA
jgi:hypothetical protein